MGEKARFVVEGGRTLAVIEAWQQAASMWLASVRDIVKAAFGQPEFWRRGFVAGTIAVDVDGADVPPGWRINRKAGSDNAGRAMLDLRSKAGKAIARRLDDVKPRDGFALAYAIWPDGMHWSSTPGWSLVAGRWVLVIAQPSSGEPIPTPEGARPLTAAEYEAMQRLDAEMKATEAANAIAESIGASIEITLGPAEDGGPWVVTIRVGNGECTLDAADLRQLSEVAMKAACALEARR